MVPGIRIPTIPFSPALVPPHTGLMRKEPALIRTIIILILTVFVTASGAPAENGKMNSALEFQRHLRSRPMKGLTPGIEKAPGTAADMAVVTVKFDRVLSQSDIEELEAQGLVFYYIDGEVARTGAIYPARVPWDRLDSISGRIEVQRIEGAWRPAVYPTLDLSAAEIEADSAWTHVDPLGLPVTGEGTRIADFDTGIDVFHPSFFRADGDTFDWLDSTENGQFDSGMDAVDLNGNGIHDWGEDLAFYDGRMQDWAGVFGPNNDYVCQTYWDWLYNDENMNDSRDYGPSAGFTESDPSYGEPLYIALDENDNHTLDIGEKLVALGTSKIYATMNADSIERVRGTDLILSDDDTNGHGTAVSGVLAGGWPGRHRLTGIAPGAEILAGYFFSGVPISYLVPWARSRGADAMLYEFGGFIWEFLDGSSLDEEIISIENSTIIQITPSGNLGRGAKHALATVPASGSITFEISVPSYGGGEILYFYGSTLWRTDTGDLTFLLRSPDGGQITLDGMTWFVDDYYVWYSASASSRGTCKLDMYIDRNSHANAQGIWELTVQNNTGAAIEVISNIADHLSSWAGGAEFTNYVSDQKNVTFPATSDSSFTNGSYSTRGFEGYGGVGGGSVPAGEISKFSGRGERIDGLHLLDVCSPGNYDVYSTRTHQDGAGYPPGSYRQFSGTSAAGPHVAAAAALVQQVFPGATMADVATLLRSSAIEDGFTGTTYNDTWGYGKLRILRAIGIATGVEDMADGLLPPALYIGRSYPNPFNPTTWIPFYIPSAGRASIRIYNVRGELMKTLRDRWYDEGAHSVRWDGTGGKGQAVSSGVYFCVLRQGEQTSSRKLVLMR